MAFEDSDLAHIRATRPAFTQDGTRTAKLFFDILFSLDPELRKMFPSDVSDQGRKFVATLAVIIDSANDWKALEPVLQSLARRHLAHAVEPAHYEVVGDALMETLRQIGLAETRIDAWSSVYREVSGYMREVAYPDYRI